jgi:hypothetical protein
VDREGGVPLPSGKINTIPDVYKEHEKELEFVEQAGQERSTGIRLVNLASTAA